VPTREHLRQQFGPEVPGGPKSLYDAIFAASGKLAASTNAKKVLIVLTDGEDKSSHHSLRELRARLRAINLPLYSLTFGSDSKVEYGYSDILRDGPRQRLATGEATAIDRASIAELSKESGGGSAEADIRNRAYLAALGRQLLHDVRSQYVIGFLPETFDGKWHELKISVTGPQKGLKVTGRKGYQSPAVDRRK
jgi:VWFA-related protein